MTSHPMTLPFQGAKSPQLDKTSNWKEVLTLNPTSGGYRTAVAYSGQPSTSRDYRATR